MYRTYIDYVDRDLSDASIYNQVGVFTKKLHIIGLMTSMWRKGVSLHMLVI